jgi:hypothetical protein
MTTARAEMRISGRAVFFMFTWFNANINCAFRLVTFQPFQVCAIAAWLRLRFGIALWPMPMSSSGSTGEFAGHINTDRL